ncbi:DNA_pol_B_2 domain-containing protein [Trichonephila clavipes]|nr:DNA_pol_B_2 domain-containing protein [Trichonephila clavipes]
MSQFCKTFGGKRVDHSKAGSIERRDKIAALAFQSPVQQWITNVNKVITGNTDYTGMWVRLGSTDLMAGKVMFLRSNQSGRLDSNESVADSFRSDLVGFKSWSATILGAFYSFFVCQKNPPLPGSSPATRGSGKSNRRVLIPSIDQEVPDDDLNICCAKAIILAIAEVEKNADLRSLREKDCCLLQRRAIALHQKAGVPQGPCRFEEIALFEQYLKMQVIVVSTIALNRKCCKVILRKVCPKGKHQCEEKRCPSCKKTVAESHMCYLQKESAKKCNEKLIFFDFETDQTTGEHVVHFAVAQYLDGTEFVCEGCDAIDKFCKYLFSPQHKGFTAIAHNMKGFDGQFILRWMLEQGQCPRVIPNGLKIMCITLFALSIRIIDSFNFFPMPLSKLSKAFGLEELAKGYFPHLFNCPSNRSYVGSFPDSDLFSPSSMSSGGKKKNFCGIISVGNFV